MNTAINKNFSPQTKSFILSTVAVSITIWNVSFNLGAFGDIFFNDFFTVWVIASVTLLCCLLLPKRQSPVGRLGLLIMAFPTVGFLFSFLDNITVNPRANASKFKGAECSVAALSTVGAIAPQKNCCSVNLW